MLVSKVLIHENVPSAFAAEAIACLQAVKMGKDFGWGNVLIEGNALSIIKKCNPTKLNKSKLGTHIFYVHKMLQFFQQIQFVKTSRTANELAHMLATISIRG